MCARKLLLLCSLVAAHGVDAARSQITLGNPVVISGRSDGGSGAQTEVGRLGRRWSVR